MPSIKRLTPTLAVLACGLGLVAPAAQASTTQQSIIEDDAALHADTPGTLATMKSLGVTVVKVSMRWNTVAPSPSSSRTPSFNASNPNAYPSANWAYYDTIVRDAAADGLRVGFTVTGLAPRWATGPGKPGSCAAPCEQWKPSASAFGQFATAVGRRYSGSFVPSGSSTALPRVDWWSIWNEPNYGPDLAPQGIDGNTVVEGAILYRGLLAAGWNGLRATGHSTGSDTILIGETAPRGISGPGFPGNFSGTKPIPFLQALYCLTAGNHRMTGALAARNQCPSSAAAFRAQNPALFAASGYAAHPYAQGTPPNTPTYACGLRFCVNNHTKRSDLGYADFAVLPRLEHLLDTATAAEGAGRHFPIYNTEFGYWTNPPDSHLPASIRFEAIAPALAAYYDNWAEYLSYTSSRIVSFDQYLLVDPPDGSFADGLELANHSHLATYDAFATPMFMPQTTAAHAASLRVWGALRSGGAGATAQIQFASGASSSFSTVKTVTVNNPRGYFSTTAPFTGSGRVRIAWSPASSVGSTVYSRAQAITIG